LSQHDLTIANQGFPAFRSDLNDALQALGSMQSGTSAPATTFANMLWYDTTNNIVKMRNEDNDAWISLFTLDQSGDLVSAISAATGSFGALSATGNVTLGDSSSDTATVNAKTTFGSEISAPNTFGFKNRIINGAMVIDQRNAGASVTISSTTGYGPDRFRCDSASTQSITVQQVNPSLSGFSTSLLYTVGTGSTVAGDNSEIVQFVEGYNVADLQFGTANAQTITLSFWAKSSLTGTFGLILENGASNRQYVTTYSIPVANTWTYITKTIVGDNSGTWLYTNGRGITVRWDMGVGITNSIAATNAWGTSAGVGVTGTTKLTQTTGATFNITGVQLEKGSTATSFDYRPYGTELALCQRYYAKVKGNGSTDFDVGSGLQTSTTAGVIYTKYPTTMRSAPTASISNVQLSDHVSFANTATLGSFAGGFDSGFLSLTISAAGAQNRAVLGYVVGSSNGYVDFSAEL